MIEFGVRARVGVKVRARVRDSWGTKRLRTKRSGYEISGSHQMNRVNSRNDLIMTTTPKTLS